MDHMLAAPLNWPRTARMSVADHNLLPTGSLLEEDPNSHPTERTLVVNHTSHQMEPMSEASLFLPQTASTLAQVRMIKRAEQSTGGYTTPSPAGGELQR